MSWENILKVVPTNREVDDSIAAYFELKRFVERVSYGEEDIDDLANALEKYGLKTAVEDNEISLATKDNKLMGTVVVLELNEMTREFDIIASKEERKNILDYLEERYG